MDALRTRFPHVLVLAFEPDGVLPDERGYRARTAGRDDLAVAAEFVRHVSQEPPTEGEEELLKSAFEAVRTEEDAD
jgi:exonuclease SbcD